MSREAALRSLTGALVDLSRWMDAERIGGVVIGGVAASLLGRPRLTRDIDAVVVTPESEWGGLITSAAHYGIELRLEAALDFARHARVLLLRHVDSGIDIDLTLGGLPFERELIARARNILVAGREIRVATVEDLVVMKSLAGRARDWSDIEGLLDVNPSVDLDYIRRWLREFAAVLEKPEIHEDFERALRRRSGQG